jgi:hypothetical protein
VDAQTWVAIAAAVIAVIALYFNAQYTRAADRAVRSAEAQTKIQQQLRIDAAQPYIWVDVRPDDVTGTLLNLVIGNSGPTVATNVRVQIVARPGNLGGSDSWEDAGSWRHRRSTPRPRS